MSKKVLVLGATGAMGKYLVPKLLEMGYQVDAVALDTFHSDAANLRNIVGDAMDWQFRDELFKNNYDGIVDFMKYTSAQLPLYLPALLDNTEHYIYLSSYRVYDNKEVPIKETSPRLLDTADEILPRTPMITASTKPAAKMFCWQVPAKTGPPSAPHPPIR